MKTTDHIEKMIVNETIRQFPATVEVFNRHGIDACCGGARSIVDAAVLDGADVDALVREVEQVIAGSE